MRKNEQSNFLENNLASNAIFHPPPFNISRFNKINRYTGVRIELHEKLNASQRGTRDNRGINALFAWQAGIGGDRAAEKR